MVIIFIFIRHYAGKVKDVILRPVYSDTTQLN